jgi:hypothetical protein
MDLWRNLDSGARILLYRQWIAKLKQLIEMSEEDYYDYATKIRFYSVGQSSRQVSGLPCPSIVDDGFRESLELRATSSLNKSRETKTNWVSFPMHPEADAADTVIRDLNETERINWQFELEREDRTVEFEKATEQK